MTASVVRGTSTLFDAYFYEEDGTTPQYAVGGVSYVVNAFNNMLITSGIAEQDVVNPARWKLNLTIPDSAPLTQTNDFYTLVWRAKTKNGAINTQRDKFSVIDGSGTDTGDDGATVVLQNQPFELSLTTDAGLSSLSLRIIREGSSAPIITLPNIIDTQGNGIKVQTVGNQKRYTVYITDNFLPAINSQRNQGGFNIYFAYYNYLDSQGNPQTVINPIYVVNSTVIGVMNNINQYCNILRNQDVVKQLQITESKLVHFAMQGLLKVNATSPGNFGFNWDTLGLNQTFYYWVTKCAQYELLSALYLAEGMSAFEFSGMTVQLNSDRSQYIAQAMANLQGEIDSQLPKVKSQYARAGGGSGRMGTIGLNLGPNSNFFYGRGLGLLGGQNGLLAPTILPFL